MPRKKSSVCPFKFNGKTPENGDLIKVGSAVLQVVQKTDGWHIKDVSTILFPALALGEKLKEIEATATGPKLALVKTERDPDRWTIDKHGFARNPKGEQIMPFDIPGGEVLYDERGEGDLGSITWADGTQGVAGHGSIEIQAA